MDIETITKLLDAGYTKADIDKLQGTDNAGSEGAEGAEGAGETGAQGDAGTKNAGAQAGETGAQGDAGTKNAGAVNGDVAEMLKTLTDTVNGLTTTVKALQDANAKGAKTDNPKATDEIKTAMDSFIAKL